MSYLDRVLDLDRVTEIGENEAKKGVGGYTTCLVRLCLKSSIDRRIV